MLPYTCGCVIGSTFCHSHWADPKISSLCMQNGASKLAHGGGKTLLRDNGLVANTNTVWLVYIAPWWMRHQIGRYTLSLSLIEQ